MKQINFNKLETDTKGKVISKKIKYSKDNALEINEEDSTKDERKILISKIKESRYDEELKYKYEVLVHLMMSAGLRVTEAIQTRSSWFKETQDGVIIIVPSLDRDLTNMKKDWKPKTKAGSREVIFVDKAIGEKVKSYFIGKKKGVGMKRQRAYQVVKMFGKQINKPELHPHALRSTYANYLVYQGVNMSTLCYYMGWDNLETARHYFKTSNVAARKDLMEKVRKEQ